MAYQDIAKGKWAEFKGEMQKMWGDLKDDDLERTKGNVGAIGGLIQQRYGDLKDEAKKKFDDLLGRYGHKAVDATDAVKTDLRNSKVDSKH